MSYKYHNLFNMTDELSKAISKIISKKENNDYICKPLIITFPKHEELIFSSPLEGYIPFGGGLKALSGAQIHYVNGEYGKYDIGTIPQKSYQYLIIINKEQLDNFSKLKFNSEEEIKKALEEISVFYIDYDGIFDSRKLSSKFPYLEDFFNYLDEWRNEIGRVTLDKNIILNGVKKL